MLTRYKKIGIIHFNLANFCSVSFGGERNGTQRKAADVPAWLKINCVPLKALKCHTIVWHSLSIQGTNAFFTLHSVDFLHANQLSRNILLIKIFD
jgi:hypothetical protein